LPPCTLRRSIRFTRPRLLEIRNVPLHLSRSEAQPLAQRLLRRVGLPTAALLRRLGVVYKLGWGAAHSLPCAAEPPRGEPGVSLSLVVLRAWLSPPFLGTSLSAFRKRSTAILCAIKCSVEPDHDAVRQYTRAALPLWSAVFSVPARCNTLKGLPQLGAAARLPEPYEYILLKAPANADALRHQR
jgi:hypothetical protein